MNLYPLGLKLDGLRVLVVGAGAVATRRVPALLDAGAEVTVVAPEATPALEGMAQTGRITLHRRRFEPADVDGAWLVTVAVDDPAAGALASAAARERKVFCVRADDRHAATAWTPAVTRHGPVTVAVLGGGDPKRSAAVRDSIRDHLESANEEAAEPQRGTVALVGGGPGDPELITVRGRRLVAAADVVVVDRLAPGLLLDELRPEAEVVDASKIPYGPARTQEEINAVLVDRAVKGKFVVRLKGGDPYLFGRGGEELLACAAHQIPVLVVPGVTSALAAPAAAGIPVTHRGVAHELVVVSGHLPPGHPESLVDWSALGRLRGTLCVLMGLKNLPAIAAALIDGGRPPTTPAAVVQEATTAAQQVVHATLATVAGEAARVAPPAVVIIGDVVRALSLEEAAPGVQEEGE
ncbi:uroporphyrinogen-III C-methyltransferase [Virgisporangium ochraceum]|uniref:Uroporphyrinogen-III C-methyltransferase n=2 Tax=Virgisporangium ochraceum TaxID=65505 RepID=A0A8J4EAH0_9ACTN|nr:uroporphyrinogen-III C-methyltransferase [Virgisporangium ochraceum]